MSSKLTRNEFFHTPKRGKSQVADGADELKDTPLLSSFPACTQRALSNTIWRIMDWGHQAPFYVLFPLFFGRATNLPRVNMATGCLVVTTVTTRGHNGHTALPAGCDRSRVVLSGPERCFVAHCARVMTSGVTK